MGAGDPPPPKRVRNVPPYKRSASGLFCRAYRLSPLKCPWSCSKGACRVKNVPTDTRAEIYFLARRGGGVALPAPTRVCDVPPHARRGGAFLRFLFLCTPSHASNVLGHNLKCTCGNEGETVIFGGRGRPRRQHASATYLRMQG